MFNSLMRKFHGSQDGAGAIEYGLIAGMIGVAAVAGMIAVSSGNGATYSAVNAAFGSQNSGFLPGIPNMPEGDSCGLSPNNQYATAGTQYTVCGAQGGNTPNTAEFSQGYEMLDASGNMTGGYIQVGHYDPNANLDGVANAGWVAEINSSNTLSSLQAACVGTPGQHTDSQVPGNMNGYGIPYFAPSTPHTLSASQLSASVLSGYGVSASKIPAGAQFVSCAPNS